MGCSFTEQLPLQCLFSFTKDRIGQINNPFLHKLARLTVFVNGIPSLSQVVPVASYNYIFLPIIKH